MIINISPLPEPPSRNDPSTFSDKADSFLGAIPNLVSELNTFVDQVNTLSFKTACKVATTTNLSSLTTNSLIQQSGSATIDGVNIIPGDRVLVKNQTNPAQNGIYIVSVSGSVAWSRAPDMDSVEEVSGAFVPITYGTNFGGKIFYTNFNPSGSTLGTTSINFLQLIPSGEATSVLPVASLEVTGYVSFDGGNFVFNDSGADKDARFEGDTDASLLFLDASTDRVGIGTSTPSAKLAIEAGTNALAINLNSTNANGVYSRFQNSGTSIGDLGAAASVLSSGVAGDFAITSRSGNLVFGTGTNERMRINASGNVGVNSTPSASSKFYSLSDNDQNGIFGQTAGSGSSYYGVYGATTKASSLPSGGTIGLSSDGTTFGILGYNDTSAHWGGYFNGNVYVSGNVGIGTGSPSSFAKLAVSGSVTYTPNSFFSGTGGNTSWTTGFAPQALGVSIYSSNALVAGAAYVLSDVRLKKDVATLPSGAGLEFVKTVDPVSFSWKADNSTDTGFIAQSLMSKGYGHLVSAVPDLAMEEATHEDGSVSPAGSRFIVRYDSIIPILAAAIRDQQALIDDLTARVVALEAK